MKSFCFRFQRGKESCKVRLLRGGAFSYLKKEISSFQKAPCMAAVDETVFRLYEKELLEALKGIPLCKIKSGERQKNPRTLIFLLSQMERAGLNRKSRLYCLGGGALSDLCGLAAGLYMRGIEFVLFPSTLLSQADAALGGKCAVNFAGVKNLVGGFFLPREVVVDSAFLATLKKRELVSGLGEIVKCGALSKGLFEALEGAENLFDLEFLSSAAYESLRVKCQAAMRDPLDISGARQALNLGHTAAHALEAESGLPHGTCVLFGLLLESRLAKRYFACDEDFLRRLEQMILSILGNRPLPPCSFQAARRDKKNEGENVVSAVPTGFGTWERLSLPFEEYEREILKAAGR